MARGESHAVRHHPFSTFHHPPTQPHPTTPLQLVLAFLLTLASEGLGIAIPLVIAGAYDALIDPELEATDIRKEVNKIMVRVIFMHSGSMFLGFVKTSIMGVAGERVVARLRNRLYRAILRQEIGFFDQRKSGELVSRLGTDTTTVQTATSQSLPEVANGVCKVIVAVVLMINISGKLTGIVMGVAVFILIVAMPFGAWIGKISKQYQDTLGEAQNCSTEALGAMKTVRAFGAETVESERYEKLIGKPDTPGCCWYTIGVSPSTYSLGYKKSIVGSLFGTGIFWLGLGAMYTTLWLGFLFVVDGEFSLGDLTAFQSFIFQIGFG